MKASLKNARISPKKMNLVAGLVRGKSAKEALNQLKFTPKKGADILGKVIHSAVTNATNNFDQSLKNLYVKSILITKGMTYKRGIPVSRGRYHPILKRNSNIVVEVGLLEPSTTKKATATKEDKPVEASTKKTSTSEKTTAKKPEEKEASKTTKKPSTAKKTSKKKETKEDK